MVGITLTPERIRSAPPEVRRWLEREIAASFGPATEPEPAPHPPKHLVACSKDEVDALYAGVRGMLPVVSVFFELGREGESVGREGIEAYRLIDVLRHTRLQSIEQLASCLQVIDGLAARIRHDESGTVCALDPRGYCLVAAGTQRNIANLWQHLLAGRDRDPTFQQPGAAQETPAGSSALEGQTVPDGFAGPQAMEPAHRDQTQAGLSNQF
jgi:hypothetical protein